MSAHGSAVPSESAELDAVRLPGLADKVVAITGGASGIGRAAAMLAARSGARVVVGDLNPCALDDVASTAAGLSLPIATSVLDVSDRAATEVFVASAAEDPSFGGLVCCAGVAPDVSVLDMSWEQWDRVIDVNLGGTFAAVQTAVRSLIARGASGSIVTVGSAVGTTGAPGLAHYAASKGGVVALTKAIARELGPRGIRLNCVSPGGAVNTPMYLNRVTQDIVDARVAGLPMRRIGEPEDIAHMIGFLLSSSSAWITGQNFHVNGGSIMP